jgi:hypothetical protein
MRTKLWSGNLKGRDILQCVGVDERIILKLISYQWLLPYGLDDSGSGYEPVACSSANYINVWASFLDHQNDF